MPNRIQFRRGTAARWTAVNPVLAVGEPGFEIDTGQMKIGDGVSRWSDLDYLPPAGAPGAVDWGDIGGTLSDQTDLQTALDGKSSVGHTHPLSEITGDGALAALNTVGTAQIDDNSVTYAKIQDVSAASRLLGRGSGSGAGDTQELVAGNYLSITPTALNFAITQTAAESAAGVTPTLLYYPPLNVLRYGADNTGSSDSSTAFQDAIDVLIEANGGEIFVPAGEYRINSALTVDGQLATTPAEFSFVLRGEGRHATRMVWYGSNVDMLTIGNGAGNPQNGIGLYEIGFYADSSHTIDADTDALVHIDYGLDGRIQNCAFMNGKGTLLYLGRAQNLLVLGCELEGDGTNTEHCIYVTDAPSGNGQGLKLISNTIRAARGGTTGAGIWITTAGGGEHIMFGNMIEGNKIGILLEGQRHSVIACSFENSVSTDTQIKVGVTAGTRSQHHTIELCTMSASGHSNKRCIDLENYNDIRIERNRFINLNGANVVFGSDENNSPSYLINNELSMDNVAFNGTDGKVVVHGNSSNGTNNPRKTLSDGETTPSVANFDIIATANTGATTITNFLNGYPGKIIMVAAEDANTSVGSGARIDTLTGATIALPNGSVAQFQAYVGSGATDLIIWKQIQNLDFNVAGGGGVSDGDKGDISVTGSGATWTIDNDVVTFAKMQDISTDRLIGRDTAATGDPEQVSVTNGLEFTGGPAVGIANGGVTLARMADLAQDLFIVRTTASTGVPQTATCTAAARTVLDDTTVGAMLTTMGGVNTANSPNSGEWAKFTAAATIEGRTAAEVRSDLEFETTIIGADTAVNNVADQSIASRTVTGLAAGDQVIVEAFFTILNNSGATRVYTITLDFDAAFDIEFSTGALANSSTLMHPFRLEGVLDIRSTSLAYCVVECRGQLAAGIASGGDVTQAATMLQNMSWATSANNLTGSTNATLVCRSANGTATQTFRLHSFCVRKLVPT